MCKSKNEEKIARIIGNNVLKARKTGHLIPITQVKAAKEIGISRTAYLNIEKGLVVPKVTVLLDIAEYFNVKINDLLKGVEEI